MGSVIDAQLMPEREDLDLKRCSGPEDPGGHAEQRGEPGHDSGIVVLLDG